MHFGFRDCLLGVACAAAMCQAQAADPPPVAPHVSMSFSDLANGDIVVTITAHTMAGWESLHFTTLPPDTSSDGLPPGGKLTDDDPDGDWVLTQNTIALSGPANNAHDTVTFTIVYPKGNVTTSTKALTFVPDDQGVYFAPTTPYTVDYGPQADPTIKALAAVPEPGTIALVLAGLALVARRSRASRAERRSTS